jgi:predicted nucleic acid-binding protein
VIVLDASALVDVVLDRPTKPWVLDRLSGESVSAPAHQPAEVLSALARLVRAEVIDAVTAQEAMVDAASLRQDLVLPSRAQLLRALQMSEGVRVLDALYVVLAQDLEAEFVTTDGRLARAGLPVEVSSPAD